MFSNIPIRKICVSRDTLLRDVIVTIQDAEKQIALVVEKNMFLLGTITDGDVRRSILKGIPLDTPASEIMQRDFIAGRQDMSSMEIFNLMGAKKIRHIPLVDEKGILTDLAWITDLLDEMEPDISAVVMAGGFGKRLHPLTETIPKPMLPIGDKPLLEHIIGQLQRVGIRRVNLTTHYLGTVISHYFGDGKDFGVDIQYVEEEQPLGTAGALSLLDDQDEPLLVINGDILTKVDFRAMLGFHQEHQADMTVAVREHEFQIPYGVVETDGVKVTKIVEKPNIRRFINAGIYLIRFSKYL